MSTDVTNPIHYVPTYTHLIFAALLPILTGAHASLRRPLNTLSPKETKKLRSDNDEHQNEDDDDDDDESSFAPMENLTTSDAMMFPITAGALLGTLYIIIKYLDDPTLLSRILTWYFCAVGTLAVGKAFADILKVFVQFVFPRQCRNLKGKVLKAGYDSWVTLNGEEDTGEPIPCVALPSCLHDTVWGLRRSLYTQWRCSLTVGKDTTKKAFWIGDLIGQIVGVVVVGIYAAGGKHWFFTNVIGISFSYGAMQLLSPTTFQIATLLLGLLFIYDVFFVFYTPLMVTVAKSLDVPIKLLFPRPGLGKDGKPALAMLGLGDIVLPGIVIGMALRWDLWKFYELKRRTLIRTASEEKGDLTKAEKAAIKPQYTKASGNWGLLFWDPQAVSSFPKTYFKASVVGYTIGMLTTLFVMHVFEHAQPALLYLVPGVLGSVWGTAFVMGEVKVMWYYSEEEPDKDITQKDATKKDATKKDEKEKEDEKMVRDDIEQDVLQLNIVRRPAFLSKTAETKTKEDPSTSESDENASVSSGEVIEKPKEM